jgi:hypothetical protein
VVAVGGTLTAQVERVVQVAAERAVLLLLPLLVQLALLVEEVVVVATELDLVLVVLVVQELLS